MKAEGHFADARGEVRRLAGPCIEETRIRIAAVRYMEREAPNEYQFFATTMRSTLEIVADKSPDFAGKLCARSGEKWIELDQVVRSRQEVVRLGFKPEGPRARLTKLRDRSTFLLPELASDARRELAETALLCGDRAGAEAEFAEALKVAPDRYRRALAEDGLRRARERA